LNFALTVTHLLKAGAVAEKFLFEQFGTQIVSFVTSVGEVELPQALQERAWTREEVGL
jgi:chorismate synthase